VPSGCALDPTGLYVTRQACTSGPSRLLVRFGRFAGLGPAQKWDGTIELWWNFDRSFVARPVQIFDICAGGRADRRRRSNVGSDLFNRWSMLAQEPAKPYVRELTERALDPNEKSTGKISFVCGLVTGRRCARSRRCGRFSRLVARTACTQDGPHPWAPHDSSRRDVVAHARTDQGRSSLRAGPAGQDVHTRSISYGATRDRGTAVSLHGAGDRAGSSHDAPGELRPLI